jgi:hypothetical protein
MLVPRPNRGKSRFTKIECHDQTVVFLTHDGVVIEMVARSPHVKASCSHDNLSLPQLVKIPEVNFVKVTEGFSFAVTKNNEFFAWAVVRVNRYIRLSPAEIAPVTKWLQEKKRKVVDIIEVSPGEKFDPEEEEANPFGRRLTIVCVSTSSGEKISLSSNQLMMWVVSKNIDTLGLEEND